MKTTVGHTVVTSRHSTGWLVILGLVSLYITWGSSYVGIRVAVTTVPPLAGSSIRFLAAALVLALVVLGLRGRQGLITPPSQVFHCVVIGALLIGGANGFVTLAATNLSAGMTAAVFATAPGWMVTIQLFAGARTSLTSLLGLLFGLLGVCLLVLPQSGSGTWSLTAIAFAMLAAISWAVGSVSVQFLDLPDDWLVSAVYQLTAGGIVLGVVAAAHREVPTFGRPTLSAWTAIAYLTVVSTVLSYPVYVWLLGRASANLVGTLVYVNPLVALGLGVALLHEAVDLQDFLAVAVILGSVAVVVRAEAPQEPAVIGSPLAGIEPELLYGTELIPPSFPSTPCPEKAAPSPTCCDNERMRSQ